MIVSNNNNFDTAVIFTFLHYLLLEKDNIYLKFIAHVNSARMQMCFARHLPAQIEINIQIQIKIYTSDTSRSISYENPAQLLAKVHKIRIKIKNLDCNYNITITIVRD